MLDQKQTQQQIIRILREYLHDEETVITAHTRLAEAVGLDSLDMAGFLNDVEVFYEISIPDADLEQFTVLEDAACRADPLLRARYVLTVAHIARYVLNRIQPVPLKLAEDSTLSTIASHHDGGANDKIILHGGAPGIGGAPDEYVAYDADDPSGHAMFQLAF
jgi:acyl carrier protein